MFKLIIGFLFFFPGFPGDLAGKESACNVGDLGSIPGLGREWLPTPVLWPGEFYRLYSPWGHKESDLGEQLNFNHRFYFITRSSPSH